MKMMQLSLFDIEKSPNSSISSSGLSLDAAADLLIAIATKGQNQKNILVKKPKTAGRPMASVDSFGLYLESNSDDDFSFQSLSQKPLQIAEW